MARVLVVDDEENQVRVLAIGLKMEGFEVLTARSSDVALFIYLQPAVASLAAWLWLGEIITPRTLTAGLLIFVGMTLGLSRRKGAEARRP